MVDRLSEEGVLQIGFGDSEVDSIIEKFKTTFGTTKASKHDRYAAHRLAGKYGSQSVCGIIQMLAEHRDEKYVPVIGSVTQLEDKMVSVLHFLRSLKTNDTIDV